MATKLKNIRSNFTFKSIAFLLAVLLATMGITLFIYIISPNKEDVTSYVFNSDTGSDSEEVIAFYNVDVMDNEHYENSNMFRSQLYGIYDDLYQLADRYPSEKAIRAGETIDPKDVAQYEQVLYAQDDTAEIIGDNGENLTQAEIIAGDAFQKKYAGEIEAYKNKLIARDLLNYQNILEDLKKAEKAFGMQWFSQGKKETARSSEDVTAETIAKAKVYFLDDRSAIASAGIDGMRLSEYSDEDNLDYVLGFTLDSDKMMELSHAYTETRETMVHALQMLMAFMAGALICVVLSVWAAGHKAETEGISLGAIDRLPIDIHFLLLCFVDTACISAFAALYSRSTLWVCAVFIAVMMAASLAWLLSLVRLIKAGELKNHLSIICLWRWLKRHGKTWWRQIVVFYRDVIAGGSLGVYYLVMMILIAVVGIWLCVSLPLLGVLFIIAVIWSGAKQARELEKVARGLVQIRNGATDTTIDVNSKSPVYPLAENINAINSGMQAAVETAVNKEIKSERLKTELITNVSHDIRTPLTSIITYIDLLKQEKGSAAEQKEYIDILDRKAQRLKTLTDDLFEAAKASTGNIEVHLEPVRLGALISQAVGEFDDRLAERQLTVIVNNTSEDVQVTADGVLMWRVVENLFSNIIKYALAGSRVYVDIDGGMLTVKNMSAEALNIPASELMERFTRGDDTRHSEGSGLGLAIARDLTVLQGGHFELAIDGDLFKVIIELPIDAGDKKDDITESSHNLIHDHHHE